MSTPRLLIISFSHIASDARVLKQVRHFAQKYDVTTCGYGPAPVEGVTHVQLPDSAGFRRWTRRDIALRRFSKIYWSMPAVVEAAQGLAGHARFDAILANDIDTVGLALRLDPVHGVHADIHEYAPRQNEEILMWRLFDAPYVTWMCRRFLPRTASMTTVGQGIADEYHRVFGLDAGIATNAAPRQEFTPEAAGAPIRLVHSGAALRNRRLETLLDAAEATSTEVLLDLYLMPSEPEYLDELAAKAAGSARVRVLPPVPYAELLGVLNGYDVGLHVIPPTNFNNRWALPNKFFDYVQARLGMIIGPSPEMARILAVHGLGAVTHDFTAAALTEVLDGLNAEVVTRWKAAAHAAAHDLSSEAQVAVWDGAIEKLLARSA
jgi:hypothetical protein